jgi:hypothetical protein
MKDHFWSSIWSSFLEVNGPLLALIGIFLSIFLARFPVKTQISLDVFIISIIVLLIILIIIFKAFLTAFKEKEKINSELKLCQQSNQELTKRINNIHIPKILYAKRVTTKINKGTLCLLEKSEFFASDSCLSFYYTDEYSYEVMIAVGHVINIQTDGKIQALIDKPVDAYLDILEKLANNDSQVLSKIIVKPTIPKNMI